jgi:RNA polymerase sigma-70 factor (ECF subfamily)
VPGPGRRAFETDVVSVDLAQARSRDEDRAIVAGLAARDEAALSALYARYALPLFTYVYGLTRERELAEEVVQDTLLAAWRGGRSFGGRSTLASWLFGIARRQCRDRLRRRRVPSTGLDEAAELPSPEPGPEAAALRAAGAAELDHALARLPGHQREVLLLIFGAGLSGPDAAVVLGIPAGTVKSRLHAARAALRASLQGGGAS